MILMRCLVLEIVLLVMCGHWQIQSHKLFCCVKEWKSHGSGAIGGQVLKNCAMQLADIFSSIFHILLQLHLVPSVAENKIRKSDFTQWHLTGDETL